MLRKRSSRMPNVTSGSRLGLGRVVKRNSDSSYHFIVIQRMYLCVAVRLQINFETRSGSMELALKIAVSLFPTLLPRWHWPSTPHASPLNQIRGGDQTGLSWGLLLPGKQDCWSPNLNKHTTQGSDESRLLPRRVDCNYRVRLFPTTRQEGFHCSNALWPWGKDRSTEVIKNRKPAVLSSPHMF